ncbi:hypothetical protein RYX56_21490, partial [Alkalihalophilus lindianensis]
YFSKILLIFLLIRLRKAKAPSSAVDGLLEKTNAFSSCDTPAFHQQSKRRSEKNVESSGKLKMKCRLNHSKWRE